jgi:hypothetical protein
MIATAVNAAAIFICSLIGLSIKGVVKYEAAILNAMGMAVLFFGMAGGVGGLIHERAEPLLFVISLVIGTLIGELLKIDDRFNRLGAFLGDKFGKGGKFAEGFVSASLLYCVGAMAIVGSLEAGIRQNYSILFTKSILDGVTSIILAGTLGIGVLFSSFMVFIYQGAWTLLAELMAPLVTEDSIRELSTVGNVLIACIALDMLGVKKIKYANMLPAVFIPVLYYSAWIQRIIERFIFF